MKVKNWEMIEESVPGGAPLAPGGYIVRIVGVNDTYTEGNENKCYLDIVYDIAEGEEAGRYADDWGKTHPYAHQCRQWYEGKHEGRFKFFLNCLEVSNKGRFSAADWAKTCDESKLVGLEFGIVLQKKLDTNTKGEDTEFLEDRGVYASQDIRSGDFKLPEPRNVREGIPAAAPMAAPVVDTVYDEDIPF